MRGYASTRCVGSRSHNGVVRKDLQRYNIKDDRVSVVAQPIGNAARSYASGAALPTIEQAKIRKRY